jgi:hypothetical protein
LGIIGALWKKKHIYTIIHYKDELDEQKIILDFEDAVEYAQGLIYKKMLEARKRKEMELADAEMELADDEKKLADPEREKEQRKRELK